MYVPNNSDTIDLTWGTRSTRILENDVRKICLYFNLGTSRIPIPAAVLFSYSFLIPTIILQRRSKQVITAKTIITCTHTQRLHHFLTILIKWGGSDKKKRKRSFANGFSLLCTLDHWCMGLCSLTRHLLTELPSNVAPRTYIHHNYTYTHVER